jgi:hypothetical protein
MKVLVPLHMLQGSLVKGVGFRIPRTAVFIGLMTLAGQKISHKIRGEQTQVVVRLPGQMIEIIMCEIIQNILQS